MFPWERRPCLVTLKAICHPSYSTFSLMSVLKHWSSLSRVMIFFAWRDICTSNLLKSKINSTLISCRFHGPVLWSYPDSLACLPLKRGSVPGLWADQTGPLQTDIHRLRRHWWRRSCILTVRSMWLVSWIQEVLMDSYLLDMPVTSQLFSYSIWWTWTPLLSLDPKKSLMVHISVNVTPWFNT